MISREGCYHKRQRCSHLRSCTTKPWSLDTFDRYPWCSLIEGLLTFDTLVENLPWRKELKSSGIPSLCSMELIDGYGWSILAQRF
ncbi:hypothetical protein PIB30_077498 [Stylosanthes scabra]|uniref:Uncharacterized protein n=1 Tax=Stylosanthes scabra TaxID=79078 RepID=A0ABU6ZP85_9FABA|nr:hypothetical protein [Stylosanthes scabra]